jgi:hypothetical protein
MNAKSNFSAATDILRGTFSISPEDIRRRAEKTSHLSRIEREKAESRTMSAIRDNKNKLETIAKNMESFKRRLGVAIGRNDNYDAVTTAKKIIKEIMDNTVAAMADCHTIEELKEAVSCAGSSFEDLVATVCVEGQKQ